MESIIARGGLFRADFLNDPLKVGFGQHIELLAFHTESGGAQLQLPSGFLSGYIQNLVFPAEMGADLEQNGRFADAGVAAQQDQRSLDNSASEHAVELL